MTEIRSEFAGQKRTDFMIGIEVEHTPAYQQKTLFVQGYKSLEEIKTRCIQHHVEHVYLGANRSFSPAHNWNQLISDLLKNNLCVTLDYLASYHQHLMSFLSESIWNHPKFIPMITVDISNLCGLSNNLTIKIDDVDLKSKGVWCINYKDLAVDARFTDWQEYKNDKTIE